MGYGLSFSEAFFYGDGTDDGYPEPSERPTYVTQAIESLDRVVKLEIASLLFKRKKNPAWFVDSEEFNSKVLEMIRETDYCDTIGNEPITVYIDKEGYYSVTVYPEDEGDDDE